MLLDVSSIRYGRSLSSFRLAVERLSVAVGEMTGVIGANGAGKTTLLRIIAGLLKPQSGEVRIGDIGLYTLSAAERARRVAWVPQSHTPTFDFTVEEAVAHGRLPWSREGWIESGGERDAVERAIERMELEDLRGRSTGALSGGELQRVAIARALAQETPLLVLDEPHAHLDVAHQVRALDALRREMESRALGVLLSLHDLNLASLYCDTLVALRGGEVIARGTPAEVLTEETLNALYGVEMEVESRVYGAAPSVRYRSRREG